MDSPVHILKILVVGDSGVGKSCLPSCLVGETFDVGRSPTIGVEFKVVTLDSKHGKIKLHIWDTAGQERFRTITNAYYRGCSGVILCFDLSNTNSFFNLRRWMIDIANYANGVPLVLVGCKSDMKHEVTKAEIEIFRKYHNIPYIETSARYGTNVALAFNTLIDMFDAGEVKIPHVVALAAPPLEKTQCCGK